MQTKTLPYLLGIIKWVNTFTFLLWTSTLLTRANFFQGEANIYISLALAFLLTQLVFTFGFGRLLQRKFGREQLIDNNRIFKIVTLCVMVIIAANILLIRKEVKIFIFILSFVLIFTFVTTMISRIRQKSKPKDTKEVF